MVQAFERELEGFGGIEALGDAREGTRIEAPSTIAHIWPALPGAGVTPVLFGFLLGARQVVRAFVPRRGVRAALCVAVAAGGGPERVYTKNGLVGRGYRRGERER